MKRRSGFVSNSSSSSFIIGCDKIPESVDEMKTLLGEKELSYIKDWEKKEKVIITADEVANRVFNDMSVINNLNEFENDDYCDDKDRHIDTIKNDSYCCTPSDDIGAKAINDKYMLEYTSLIGADINEVRKMMEADDYFSFLE